MQIVQFRTKIIGLLDGHKGRPEKRFSLASFQGLFCLLNKSHRAATCLTSFRCGAEDGLGEHHKLLHQTKVLPAHDAPKVSVIYSISETTQI